MPYHDASKPARGWYICLASVVSFIVGGTTVYSAFRTVFACEKAVDKRAPLSPLASGAQAMYTQAQVDQKIFHLQDRLENQIVALKVQYEQLRSDRTDFQAPHLQQPPDASRMVVASERAPPVVLATEQKLSNEALRTKQHMLAPSTCDYDSTIFEDVYKKALWGGAARPGVYGTPPYYYSYGRKELSGSERASLSGQGSAWRFATASLNFLQKYIKRKDVKTVLDVPCGDANWQFEAWEMDSLDLYVGLDVARVVIKLNTERFAHHSNKLFAPWNIAKCPLPKFFSAGSDDTGKRTAKSFDLIHVRDVLQHIPAMEGVAALCHIANSGGKYLISTTWLTDTTPPVYDAQTGNMAMFHRVNLERPPYNFPKSKDCIPTHPDLEYDSTCFWDIQEDLKAFRDSDTCKNVSERRHSSSA